jgi:hypothetical protein
LQTWVKSVRVFRFLALMRDWCAYAVVEESYTLNLKYTMSASLMI